MTVRVDFKHRHISYLYKGTKDVRITKDEFLRIETAHSIFFIHKDKVDAIWQVYDEYARRIY